MRHLLRGRGCSCLREAIMNIAYILGASQLLAIGHGDNSEIRRLMLQPG